MLSPILPFWASNVTLITILLFRFAFIFKVRAFESNCCFHCKYSSAHRICQALLKANMLHLKKTRFCESFPCRILCKHYLFCIITLSHFASFRPNASAVIQVSIISNDVLFATICCTFSSEKSMKNLPLLSHPV